MGNALIYLLSFIAAISILVAVHEYGHYLVGRLVGMKVLRYSIGFGKPLFTYVGKKDKTEYCISAIPLGGYVRFLDSREGIVDPEDEGRAFDQRPIPARIATLLAGPAFNFLFAIVVFWFLNMDGVQATRPAVGAVEPQSYAADAGLTEGEVIVRVGETTPLDWEDTIFGILDNLVSDSQIPMTLENDLGQRRELVIRVPAAEVASITEPGALFARLGFVLSRPPVIVGNLSPDGAALAAGLRDGDRIVGVNETLVRSFNDLVPAIQALPGERVRIDYVRDQRLRSTYATLGIDGEGESQVGFLGVAMLSDNIGAGKSLRFALKETWDRSIFTVQMLGRMLTGDVSIKNISGPINIAQIAGESAMRGLDVFVDFLILISISLGVLNLLPIPVLDGGQILYQLAEAVKGSPVTERTQILGQQVGIVALLLIMSFAFYNDIARSLG